MRTIVEWLGDREISQASLSAFLQDDVPKDTKRERMKKLLKIAIKQELTQRQRDCIIMYYIKRKKVCDIAETLEIKPTTVYKHLRKGRAALKKAAAYF